MSYQLPDMLTFLTSVLHSSDDGDLHINPFYDPNLSPKSPTLLTLLHRTATATKTNKLQKTPKELIQEYNPGLLASVYLPFTSVLKAGCENEEVMRVVWEWLSVCALVVEETVRSGRIVGIEDDNESIRECLQEYFFRTLLFPICLPCFWFVLFYFLESRIDYQKFHTPLTTKPSTTT